MSDFLTQLEAVIAERRHMDPAESYVAKQLNGPLAELYRKLPEEATEVVLSCLTGEAPARIRAEAADMLFQLLLVLAKHDIQMADVIDELHARHRERVVVH